MIASKVPMDEKDPYEYILMRRSPDDFEEENNAKPTNEQLDEEQIRAEFEKQGKEIPHDTAASTKPDHKWILMRGAWISFADAVRQRGYRSPDAFDMYIYNDFEGYGICEMVDNYVSNRLASSSLATRALADIFKLPDWSIWD